MDGVLFLILASLVPILAQNGTNGSCAPIARLQPSNYTPPAYHETSLVARLASYSAEPFCIQLVADYTACEGYVKQVIVSVVVLCGGMMCGRER